MPLSVRVYGDEQPGRPGAEPIATLVLDAPRILVGRAEGSEVRLPEPSVSARHLSIRQKGNDYVLIDEGSTNGTRVGKTTLVAHAPQTMRPAEVVRVGRLWLELAVVSEPPTRGAPQVAKEIALALVTRGLSDAGEDGRPKVRVVEGPDAGTEAVIEPGAALVLGRAKDAGLPLADPEASRRHAEVKLRGDQILVRDLGSRTGTTLGDRALGGADVPWKVGGAPEDRGDGARVQLRGRTSPRGARATARLQGLVPRAPSARGAHLDRGGVRRRARRRRS